MMRRLDLDAERLQRVHHVLANLNPLVASEIKVASAVMRRAGWLPVCSNLKEEELQLWTHIHLVSELLRARNLSLQHAARIASERFACWQDHVADHARRSGAALRGCPRENSPCAHVGAQQLI